MTPVASGAGRLEGRHLYLCTPDRADLTSFLERCLRGGVDVVQLRDKHLDAKALITRAGVAARCCDGWGVPFLVNDRPDVALEAGADGVHVGQDDVPPALARRILGPAALVGLSTHAMDELEASRHEPIDYVSAGPVVPTPTKPGRLGTGLDYAGAATRSAGRPVFATGGVQPDAVGPMVDAGIRRFVVVRFLTESTDPEADARRLRSAIDAALDAAGP